MIFVVMGVSGSGKTTVGELLAKQVHCEYADADQFHPAANVAKMSAGVSLTDEDRWPWLDAIHKRLAEARRCSQSTVVSCSALKRAYRDVLRKDDTRPTFVYLKGSKELIEKRMTARQNHFMKARMLDSQFATLEEPQPDEVDIVTVSIESSAEDIVEHVMTMINGRGGSQ